MSCDEVYVCAATGLLATATAAAAAEAAASAAAVEASAAAAEHSGVGNVASSSSSSSSVAASSSSSSGGVGFAAVGDAFSVGADIVEWRRAKREREKAAAAKLQLQLSTTSVSPSSSAKAAAPTPVASSVGAHQHQLAPPPPPPHELQLAHAAAVPSLAALRALPVELVVTLLRCNRPCARKLGCGRHKCGRVCCPLMKRDEGRDALAAAAAADLADRVRARITGRGQRITATSTSARGGGGGSSGTPSTSTNDTAFWDVVGSGGSSQHKLKSSAPDNSAPASGHGTTHINNNDYYSNEIVSDTDAAAGDLLPVVPGDPSSGVPLKLYAAGDGLLGGSGMHSTGASEELFASMLGLPTPVHQPLGQVRVSMYIRVCIVI